jgi:hypothetical protein
VLELGGTRRVFFEIEEYDRDIQVWPISANCISPFNIPRHRKRQKRKIVIAAHSMGTTVRPNSLGLPYGRLTDHRSHWSIRFLCVISIVIIPDLTFWQLVFVSVFLPIPNHGVEIITLVLNGSNRPSTEAADPIGWRYV